MGLAIVQSAAFRGAVAVPVAVEVHVASGLPSTSVVGLAETAVRESRERVRSALVNSGYRYPAGRVTISLAPADFPKSGSGYDLAMAIGILIASGQIPTAHLQDSYFFGELTLAGALRPVAGLFAAAQHAMHEQKMLWLPRDLPADFSVLQDLRCVPVASLSEALEQLRRNKPLMQKPRCPEPQPENQTGPDLADLCGQQLARRAAEIAAAGRHHLLLSGPPGTGKSHIARCLPALLPTLSASEALELAANRAAALRVPTTEHSLQAPLRVVHPDISVAGLLAGGPSPKPGEICLAHHGVLFLDEAAHFRRRVLDSLREPLESGVVRIARSYSHVTYPARILLVAAMNPCPCGAQGTTAECLCSPRQISQYQGRLSVPLRDRFDLVLHLEAVSGKELLHGAEKEAEHSADVAKRVARCRHLQSRRQNSLNGELEGQQLRQHCRLAPALQHEFENQVQHLGLSARAYLRIMRVARTIADLASSQDIERDHLLEAIALRPA